MSLSQKRNQNDLNNSLKDLFSMLQINQTIIYVNTIERVNSLYSAMIDEGFPVCFIHSAMDKSESNLSI